MEKSGITFKVDESTDWCAEMICVPKPDGNVCTDVDPALLSKISADSDKVKAIKDLPPP